LKLAALTDRWWAVFLNGLLEIAIGAMALAWPGATLVALILLFAAFCIADGITALIAAGAIGARERPWGQLVWAGLLSLAIGIAAFLWPRITAVALLVLIAAWAILRGVLEIVAAIRLRDLIDDEWRLVLAGAVSVLFGLLLLVWPGAGILALVWLVGVCALLRGLLLVMLAMRLHSGGRRGFVAGEQPY
jgi:uncharacterized membrane protein HdeD (DUF308 family)